MHRGWARPSENVFARGLALSCALCCLLGAMSTAAAYRTSADDVGLSTPMGRAEATVQVLVFPAEAPGLEAGVVASAVEASASAWALPCTPLEILVLGSSTREASSWDGLTTITVITEGWVARGYGPLQAANTELRFSDEPERLLIADADIFLNADTIDWTASDAPDVVAVLVHEVAHAAFGLSHPCGDLTGIACTAAITSGSLMAPEYQAGGVVPRADDVAGACALAVGASCDRLTCGESEWCDRGRCVPTMTCDDGTSCEEGVCAVAGLAAGTCTAVGGEGAQCATGNECGSRLCLLGTAADRMAVSYCTHLCGSDVECDPSERCRVVDDASVCAPPAASGCSVGAATGSPFSLLVTAFAITWLVRRRSGAQR